MTEDTLHDVLTRATDAIESPDLAGTALTAARQRRTRHRAVLATVGSAIAVASVVAVIAIVDTNHEAPEPAPGVPTPTGLEQSQDQAPAISDEVVQPFWDPVAIEDAPYDGSTRLPPTLDPPAVVESLDASPIDVGVAAVVDDEEVAIVGVDGSWRSVALPEEPSSAGDTVALSQDGTVIAVTGGSALWWRALGVPGWIRTEYPSGVSSPRDYEPVIRFVKRDQVLLSLWPHAWLVDLTSGEAQVLKYDAYTSAPDAAGTVVSFGVVRKRGFERVLQEWRGTVPVRSVGINDLESLTSPAVSETMIGAARGDGGWTGEPTESDWDGLIALDRETLETRAYLPIKGRGTGYADGGRLGAIAWLDDETLLARVVPDEPAGSPQAPGYLFTWNVATGLVSRVSVLPWQDILGLAIASDVLR